MLLFYFVYLTRGSPVNSDTIQSKFIKLGDLCKKPENKNYKDNITEIKQKFLDKLKEKINHSIQDVHQIFKQLRDKNKMASVV